MSDYIETDDAEQLARQRLEGWWGLLGDEPHYPASTQTVSKLLAAVEYQHDADLITEAVTNNWIPPVEKSSGRLQWSAADIVCLASALEARRLWAPGSKIHGHKLSLAENLRQLAEADGADFMHDIGDFDWNALVGMLVSVSHDPGAVQVMAEAFREKLKREGVL